MARSRKHRSRGKPALPTANLGLAAWRQRIEALLANGKSRDAVEEAKQCLKYCHEPAAEALAVKAYVARIEALQANGLHREAEALCTLVSERFPASQGQLVVLRQLSALLVGDCAVLLTELGVADAARRRELEAVLTRYLTDPAIVAHSAALPDEHPVKRMARTVSDLFTAVTHGPLADGALAALDAIPRHSLFAPWKLLVRALDAFYRHADTAVLANLAAIPADTAPGRLVPVIRQLMGEDGLAEDRSFAVRTLLEQVSGKRGSVRMHLQQLSQALTDHNERQALAAVDALRPHFQSTPTALQRTFLASILHSWYRQQWQPDSLLALLRRHKNDPDLFRLIALTLEEGAWDAALDMWDAYVEAATAAGLLAANGVEMARVLLHMAQLFPQDIDVILDTLEVDSLQQLHKEIRSGDLPVYFDRAALLERAKAVDPIPPVFRALVAHHQQWGAPKDAEAAAEDWHRQHPQDLEPLLYLIRATEQRGAVRKALKFLADAEALDRVHPEVRQSRFRLLLAGAERRIKENKPTAALSDLQQLMLESRAHEGDHQIYLSVLRWAACQQLGDSTEAERLQHALTDAGNPILCTLIRDAITTSLKVKLPALAAASASPAQTLEGVVRASNLFRALERPLIVPAALLKDVEKHLPHASVSQLYALCSGGLRIGSPSLVYRAAGYGLTLHDPLVYRFLLARGQALSTSLSHDAEERARQCLRAARELAGRVHDMEAVREAAAALQALPDWSLLQAMMTGTRALPEDAVLSQEEIGQIIASESQNRTVPRFRPAAKTPKQRSARPPQRRSAPRLFEDLFRLFDFDEDF